jgi:hypothetical protein
MGTRSRVSRNGLKVGMSETTQERNKALVLEGFDTLFNRRDYAAAERFWSPSYIQHSAHIAPGREGAIQPHPEPPADAEVRARPHRG